MVKKFKNHLLRFFFLLLSLVLITPTSFAKGEEKTCFTISYSYENNKISKAEFSIYRIGDIDNRGKVELIKGFNKYPLDLKNINREDRNDYANTLKAYIQKDKLNPDFKGKTDKNGNLSFDLERGIYLVVGSDLIISGKKYSTAPYIVSLPDSDREMGRYNYKLISEPKADEEDIPKGKISKKVLKIRDDEGHEKERPKQVRVELTKGGQVLAAVNLNKANNRLYGRDKLDPAGDWNIVERTDGLKNYQVKIETFADKFILTNSYKKIGKQNIPQKNNKAEGVGKSASKAKVKLPQTGQLRRPIILLAVIGISFILLGFKQEKRKKR